MCVQGQGFGCSTHVGAMHGDAQDWEHRHRRVPEAHTQSGQNRKFPFSDSLKIKIESDLGRHWFLAFVYVMYTHTILSSKYYLL